jgi:hypothetical protein
MEEMKRYIVILTSITLLNGFVSCNKEKLANAIANSGPCNCSGNFTFSSYTIKLKQVSSNPAGSRIQVTRYSYPQNDSSRISAGVAFAKDLPFIDTTLTSVELSNYTLYFSWKVSGINGDSLSGGKTLPSTTGLTPIQFEINY